MKNLAEKDIETIVADPVAHFDGPVEMVKSEGLPEDAKQAALAVWEQHAVALEVASGEGMGPAPAETSIRAQLEQAQSLLTPEADKTTIA